jgi:predicted protein tyrosine phosphatase
MQFFVYSRPGIEGAPPHEAPHVVISITTTPDDEARIPEAPACREILRLSFPDADGSVAGYAEGALFSANDADRIWKLVLRHREEIALVVLHCDAGLSRSPGVAAALAKILEGDDAVFFKRYRPNMRVYRTMLERYHARFDERLAD